MSKKSRSNYSGLAGFATFVGILSFFPFGGFFKFLIAVLGAKIVRDIVDGNFDFSKFNKHLHDTPTSEGYSGPNYAPSEDSKPASKRNAPIKKPPVEPSVKVDTPTDEKAREVVAQGLEVLEQIRTEANAIDEYVMTRRLQSIDDLVRRMLQAVADDPDKAGRMRKFMNYYLPTIVKLLQSYRTMKRRGVSYSEMTATRENLIHALDMILQASQKQLDAMYQDNILDMSMDIDVLEQMLKRDGYMESAFAEAAMQAAMEQKQQRQAPAKAANVKAAPAQETPVQAASTQEPPVQEAAPRPTLNVPTAAARQMSHGAPILVMPEEDDPEASSEKQHRTF